MCLKSDGAFFVVVVVVNFYSASWFVEKVNEVRLFCFNLDVNL